MAAHADDLSNTAGSDPELPASVVTGQQSTHSQQALPASVQAPLHPPSASPTLPEMCSNASEALSRAAQLLRQQALPTLYCDISGIHWHLFLDYETPNLIETCAISTAIIALNAADDHQDMELLNQAANLLLALQNESGGWTSWVEIGNGSHQPEASLVIDTFFALRALDAVDMQGEPAAAARRWFCDTQDPDTGGWGFYPAAKPATLPTSMALRILGATPPRDRTSEWRQVIDHGLQWLFKAQDSTSSGAWGRSIGDDPSAVHTAMALMALRACDLVPSSHRIERAREWMLEHWQDTNSIIDVYDTPGLDAQGRNIPSRRIHHVSFPEGIILQGLVASGCAPLEPRLLDLLQALLKLQSPQGYWPCPSTAFERPVFAIMDATLGLHAFLQQAYTDSAKLETLEYLRRLDEELNRLRGSHADIMESLKSLHSEMAAIQRSVKPLKPIVFLMNVPTHLKVAIVLLIIGAGIGVAAAEAADSRTRIISGVAAFATVAVGVMIYLAQERNAAARRKGRR